MFGHFRVPDVGQFNLQKMETTTQLFELKHKGSLIFTGTENECYFKLQRVQSQSADWAMKHEGYTITELPPVKLTVIQKELLAAMKSGKLTNQNQKNLIFKILNGNNEYLKREVKSVFNHPDFNGLDLSTDQVEKGKAWLLNQWKTPKGAERKNNPYGYREQDAIENLVTITLKGYYDIGTYGHKFYVPLYDVYSKDGYGFEYSIKNGAPYIVG